MESTKALEETLVLLDFDAILQKLNSYFTTEDSLEYFKKTRPQFDFVGVTTLHKKMRELVLRSQIKQFSVNNNLHSITNILIMASKRTLQLEEVIAIKTALDAIINYKKWLEDTYIVESLLDEKNKPILHCTLTKEMIALHTLLSKYIDNLGQLKRSAIKELVELDKSKIELLKHRNEIASNYMSNNKDLCSTDVPTIRGERLVIPLIHSYKSLVEGIIHGNSASTHTVYIEIKPLYEINNKIARLVSEEEQIIYNLLKDLTENIIIHDKEILFLYNVFIDFDVLRAQYYYSQEYKGVIPQEKYSQENSIYLMKARHPLIKFCVPIDIYFSQNIQQLILTGPNAGGKTIALKILGLLAILNQCGIPIPVEEESYLPVYNSINVILGDSQNINDGVSTFSSHIQAVHNALLHTKYAYEHTLTKTESLIAIGKERQLLLFDELCDGTDEQEGSTLAWAILEYLLNIPTAHILVTTHSTLLKHYAFVQNKVQIAAVEKFKNKSYNIIYGSAGASEASKIAKEVGLDSNLITRQEELLLEYGKDTQALLQKLNSLIKKAYKQEKRAQSILHRNLETQQKLKKQSHFLSKKELALKKQSHQESIELLSKMRSSLERITEQEYALKNTSAQNSINTLQSQAKEIRTQVNNFQHIIETHAAELQHIETSQRKKLTILQIGDEVIIKESGLRASIINILEDNKYQVRVGIVTLTLFREALSTLEEENDYDDNEHYIENKFKIEALPVEINEKYESNYIIDRAKSQSQYQAELSLDVRGKNVKEVHEIIYKQLDAAIISHLYSFSIIHGTGEGKLAKAIHNILKSTNLVSSFKFATPEDGGFGKTYVFIEH